MTPKEKAQDLVDKYLQIEDSEFKNGANLMFEIEAKQCALIAVDELIQNSFPGVIKCHWEEVKHEIEKL
jgi:hypothetical protein